MHSAFHPNVGVGLRHPHYEHFLNQLPPLRWLEVHSENYFHPNSPARQTLNQLAAHYQITCHGIGLSLGSVERVSPTHLAQLRRLVEDINPIYVSDHLSWSSFRGDYVNDLLPLPYTEEALEVFCRNILEVQDAIRRPLLVENPSSYLSFSHSTMTEWAFLEQIIKRTDCRLLLDLNNVHVSAFNLGFDSEVYLSSIPASCVDEIHLAGFTVKSLPQGEIWIDTHSAPVCPEVWRLFQDWVERHGPVDTLIEWDSAIPSPEVLLQEAHLASQCLQQHTSLVRNAL